MKKLCKVKIEQKYFFPLGKIFSPIVVDSITNKGYSPYLTEVCKNSGIIDRIDPATTLGEFFDYIYNFLFRNYRNEYVYKNVIVNKLLLNKHSLNTSQILTEFRVGRNKADVVLLNGTSTVYEIKSQYDSFARLDKQLKTYFEIFDYVNVITSPSQATKLAPILPERAGLLVLTDRNTISTIRKPISNKENINLNLLFNSLRKTEYLKIIKNYYGKTPDVPNTQINIECKKLFCEIHPSRAHSLTIDILKKRNNAKRMKEFVKKAPSSVAAYAINICNEKNKMQKLLNRLDDKIDSLLVVPDGI